MFRYSAMLGWLWDKGFQNHMCRLSVCRPNTEAGCVKWKAKYEDNKIYLPIKYHSVFFILYYKATRWNSLTQCSGTNRNCTIPFCKKITKFWPESDSDFIPTAIGSFQQWIIVDNNGVHFLFDWPTSGL